MVSQPPEERARGQCHLGESLIFFSAVLALLRTGAFFLPRVEGGGEREGCLGFPKLASAASSSTAPTEQAGQVCHVSTPPSLQGRWAWPAAKATVCLLIPSAQSHRGHLTCWVCRTHTLSRTQNHSHTLTHTHTHRKSVPGTG